MPANTLTDVFRDLIKDNRTPDYLIRAETDDARPGHLRVDVTFPAGKRFCCTEPGCHFGWARGDFSRLRAGLAKAGLPAPFPLTIEASFVVEAGVILDILGGRPDDEADQYADEYHESADDLLTVDAFFDCAIQDWRSAKPRAHDLRNGSGNDLSVCAFGWQCQGVSCPPTWTLNRLATSPA